MSFPPSFSKEAPNKIGNGIEVSGKNTLTKLDHCWRAAIADKPIDAKVDGKNMFCVRVNVAGSDSSMMIGFAPMETFNSTKDAFFGGYDFTGAGIYLTDGNLYIIQKTNLTTSSTAESPKKQKKSSSFSKSAQDSLVERRRFAFFVMEKNRNRQIFRIT
jgi:hypothetical protein